MAQKALRQQRSTTGQVTGLYRSSQNKVVTALLYGTFFALVHTGKIYIFNNLYTAASFGTSGV
ncbi:hypothetical protein Hsw_3278 [Hymenobacter swuensis DY53]|uniref:Uncharacterized protein n=1 Tax=Hymenobacter swuensis DY53 TaxID=1227739 RepID=W8F1S8_9BACT|nr:hypothetical protein Hsw_3278 [Hymenobacter swuensis DY53]